MIEKNHLYKVWVLDDAFPYNEYYILHYNSKVYHNFRPVPMNIQGETFRQAVWDTFHMDSKIEVPRNEANLAIVDDNNVHHYYKQNVYKMYDDETNEIYYYFVPYKDVDIKSKNFAVKYLDDLWEEVKADSAYMAVDRYMFENEIDFRSIIPTPDATYANIQVKNLITNKISYFNVSFGKDGN